MYVLPGGEDMSALWDRQEGVWAGTCYVQWAVEMASHTARQLERRKQDVQPRVNFLGTLHLYYHTLVNIFMKVCMFFGVDILRWLIWYTV